jgi:DNA-binding LacI/PurR family transcriptional regulator
MITARDIATTLGVSVSTIGRAMADDPRISAKTKARVRNAAELAGYVGCMPARVMRGGASNLIGLVLPDVRNDFYAEIAQALSETCDGGGHRLVLAITGDDREVEARHIRELVAARASGIIIVPTASPRRESVRMLQNLAHVQLLRRLPSLGNVWFGIDDESALFEATKQLIDLGHRRIAYIGGPTALSTGESRLRGFRQAFDGAGIPGNQSIELLGPTSSIFGASAFEQLLQVRRPPTAVVTGSVHITIGLIEVAEKRNIAIPDRMSVIGFGDPAWFEWWRGGLTTIRPPVQELATTCGLWFLNRLRSKIASEEWAVHSAVANSRLVIRATAKRLQRMRPRRIASQKPRTVEKSEL